MIKANLYQWRIEESLPGAVKGDKVDYKKAVCGIFYGYINFLYLDENGYTTVLICENS